MKIDCMLFVIGRQISCFDRFWPDFMVICECVLNERRRCSSRHFERNKLAITFIDNFYSIVNRNGTRMQIREYQIDILRYLQYLWRYFLAVFYINCVILFASNLRACCVTPLVHRGFMS